MGAEFCIFMSNARGLKLYFCEPYVDRPTRRRKAASERVFSLLNAFYSAQQERALEDGLEASLMLQYNRK